MDNKSDVIIVGAGIAGITAGIDLLDQGFTVTLIDRDKEENLGGLAKQSFGGIFMVDTPHQRRMGIKDSHSLAFSDWCSTAEFDPNDDYPRQWASFYIENSLDDIYYFLKGKGIQFFPVVHWVERGMFRPGNSVPRFHMVWGTGHGLAVTLVNHLLNHKNRNKLNLIAETRVTKILREGKKVIGVQAIQEDSSGFNQPNSREEKHSNSQKSVSKKSNSKKSSDELKFFASHTIIASGGISGDIEQVRKNWPEDLGTPPNVILNGSHPFSVGDMHKECNKLGGKITHLDKMWNYAAGVHHPNPKMEGHGLSLVPPRSALWVNARGERIGPTPLITGYDTRFLVQEVCKQEEKYSWQILNWKIAVKELAVSGSEYNDAIKNKKLISFLSSIILGNKKLVQHLTEDCVDFVTAENVSELVQKMNDLNGDNLVDLGAMESAIHSYDSMIDRGKKYFNDDQLRRIAHLRSYRGDRVRTCNYQKIIDSKAMPLIAIREYILSRKSMGGIQTNLNSEVLDKKGNPMEGLYAIGESAGFGGGGIHGKGALEGTFLGSCIITARQVGRRIGKNETDKVR